jgi:flavin reductase (DIM6/NTAB) family NADH-FMN oxidoreductase RutF
MDERSDNDNASDLPGPLDPGRFRQVLGHYPTGVSAITACRQDGSPVGMLVGTFTSVSLDPPLVGFLPSRTSTTFPLIEAAGRFCVNVLSADQEALCRDLGGPSARRFDHAAWRPSALGSPILDGCVAWIDCEIHNVVDAGDHAIVLGRVRSLDGDGSRLPLLFFQRGYGKFSLLSTPPAASAELISQLRLVDSVRLQMQALAEDLGVECLAVSLIDDEMVVTGSAGRPQNRAVLTRLGQRVPLVPPMGAAFVAWADGGSVEAWLSRAAGHDPLTRERHLQILERVRQRGWSLTLDRPGVRMLESAVFHLPDAAGPEGHTEVASVLSGLGDAYEPVELDEERAQPVNNIMAPVFAADGSVALLLALYGLPELMSTSQIEMCAARLQATAGLAARAIADARA